MSNDEPSDQGGAAPQEQRDPETPGNGGSTPSPNPDPSGEPDIQPQGLQSPIIGVFQRVKRTELPIEAGREELRRLAKIAAVGAANAVLLALLKKYAKGDDVDAHTMQLDEIEVLELAAAYPAVEQPEAPPAGGAPPASEEDDMGDKPDPNWPDAGHEPTWKNRGDYAAGIRLARLQVQRDANAGHISFENETALKVELDDEELAVNADRDEELQHAQAVAAASTPKSPSGGTGGGGNDHGGRRPFGGGGPGAPRNGGRQRQNNQPQNNRSNFDPRWILVILGAIAVAALLWWLWDNRDNDDNGTPAAPAADETATQTTNGTQVPSVTDAQIKSIADQINAGTIKSRDDAVAAAKQLGLNDTQINELLASPTVKAALDKLVQTPNGTQTPTTPNGAGGNTLTGGKSPAYNAGAFRHPSMFVDCQKTFDPVQTAVDWLLCEPGVLLTNTATFTRPEVDMIHNSNCPEGGFWYGSMHHGVILLPEAAGGVRLELKDYGPGTNHLVVIRCRLSDGKRDSDLNFTMKIGSFVVGHAIWSPIPPNHPDGSAYVSMEWLGEQIVTSHTTGGTNCGSDGCSKVYVNLYDVNSQSWQEFLVTDVAGESGDSDRDGIVDYASANWQLVSSNR